MNDQSVISASSPQITYPALNEAEATENRTGFKKAHQRVPQMNGFISSGVKSVNIFQFALKNFR